MNAMPRPTVNLDAVGNAVDRALEHPIGRAVAQLFPEAAAKARAVRENLPEVASGLEARAVDVVKGELGELERGMIEGLENLLLLRPRRRRSAKRSKAKRSKPKRLKR